MTGVGAQLEGVGFSRGWVGDVSTVMLWSPWETDKCPACSDVIKHGITAEGAVESKKKRLMKRWETQSTFVPKNDMSCFYWCYLCSRVCFRSVNSRSRMFICLPEVAFKTNISPWTGKHYVMNYSQECHYMRNGKICFPKNVNQCHCLQTCGRHPCPP